MKIAVMSLCRDRLAYSQHCFGTLLENAGTDFDWFITDQGSTDGTPEWLVANTDATVYEYGENIGICPALNYMLDDVLAAGDYDVIVKVDNDAELLTPNTLIDVCQLAVDHNAILSPWILGLREPPQAVGHWGEVSVTPVVGGIFMATPAWVFENGYRHPILPTKDGDDWNLCRWFQAQGGYVGYVDGYEANHYRTTDGQHRDFPEYFARRQSEREAVAA